jgi:hypothetical protein
VQGLWATISKALDRNLWDKPDTDILSAVEARIDEERVGDVWGAIYRCVALGDVTVKDIQLANHRIKPEGISRQTWKPAEGAAVRCIRRAVDHTGRSVPPLVVEYDLQRSARMAVSAVVPMPVPTEELLSVTVPMRQDRSWHCLRFELEVDGKCYVPEDSLRLEQYR